MSNSQAVEGSRRKKTGGRKKGQPNKRTKLMRAAGEQAIAAVLDRGILPADLLITLARRKWAEAFEAIDALARARSALAALRIGMAEWEVVDPAADPLLCRQHGFWADEIRRLRGDVAVAEKAAESASVAAAPFFHAKLANIDLRTKQAISVVLKNYDLQGVAQ